MERIKIAALRYAQSASHLELSFHACVVFSALIAVALGVHYSTLAIS